MESMAWPKDENKEKEPPSAKEEENFDSLSDSVDNMDGDAVEGHHEGGNEKQEE